MFVELDDEVEDGDRELAPFRFTSEELEELDGDCEVREPFRSMSVELEELEGACEVREPFTSTSVELEEPEGACDAPAPFSWMSVELDEPAPGVAYAGGGALTSPWMSVREEEVAPGTTATPGPTSVVVLLVPDWASATLGTQPAGCVFASSMHFGAPDGIVTVYVSARATPKAASIEAARRLIVKLFRFISFLLAG